MCPLARLAHVCLLQPWEPPAVTATRGVTQGVTKPITGGFSDTGHGGHPVARHPNDATRHVRRTVPQT